MEDGYKILWTDHALSELSEVYQYLELNFTDRELKRLSIEIEKTIRLISINPTLFPFSKSKSIRRAVIMKYNTLHYRENGNIIEILSFFNNRKNPKRNKF
jgi:plasmid stabilization system protein ParE